MLKKWFSSFIRPNRLGGFINGNNLFIDAWRVYEINLLNGKATYKGKFDRDIIDCNSIISRT
jgi:hypothetical protein